MADLNCVATAVESASPLRNRNLDSKQRNVRPTSQRSTLHTDFPRDTGHAGDICPHGRDIYKVDGLADPT
jgi:hypothetical protein